MTRVLLAAAAALSCWAGSAWSAPPATQPARVLNDQLLNMPDNTWVHIKSNRNPVGRSYSGICYGDGLVFYFGGGHGSHAGNGVELYDVAANTWTLATEEEYWTQADRWTHLPPADIKLLKQTIGGGSTTTQPSPLGRPLTHHTYQMHAFWPEQKAFYCLVSRFLWSFDPAKREWKLVNRSGPQMVDVHTRCLRYEPNLHTLVAIVGAGPGKGVYLYDQATNSWKRKCDTLANDWSEVHAAYDPAGKRFVVYCNKKWWTLDAAAGKVQPIASLADARKDAGLKPARLETLSLDFDPEAKAGLVALNGPDKAAELWAYDVAKDAWSQVTLAGQPPRGILAWGQMDYDPEHRCHLILNLLGVGSGFVGGQTGGFYAFRLKPADK